MLVSHFMITYLSAFGKFKRSSTLSRAHGKGGASATILSFLSVPPSEKIAGGFQQAGSGWEADRPCVSKEAKPAKIDSLIEKKNCARQLVQSEKSSRKVYNYGTVKQKPNLSWVSV